MADNDTYVQVQPNSTGARVDCTLLDNGNVRQTVVIGDPTGSSNVALIIGGTLAAADVLDAGVGTPDNAGYSSIIGDPSGDFAGVNLLEALMDDASGLSLGVRVLNQPKLGPDGALQISDGKQLNLVGPTGGNIIVDTLGYGSIQITSQAMASANCFWSNDAFTWQQVVSTAANGIAITGFAANTSCIYPCLGRYFRIQVATGGTAVMYLRSMTWPMYAATQNINVNSINGQTPASPGPAGFVVGGNLAAAPGTSAAVIGTVGAPVGVGGVDINNFIRRPLLDISGAFVLSGWRYPLIPDTKTTNPLPAFTPPPPVKVSLTDDTPGPDTPGLLDSLRLMTALLASIDRRLQELPGNIATTRIDTDDFNASDVLSLIN